MWFCSIRLNERDDAIKLKRPMMYKIMIILQIVWILIIVVDIVAIGLGASPIFASEIWGGECLETIGLGYKITIFYPMSSVGNPSASATQLNANGLLFGQGCSCGCEYCAKNALSDSKVRQK